MNLKCNLSVKLLLIVKILMPLLKILKYFLKTFSFSYMRIDSCLVVPVHKFASAVNKEILEDAILVDK